MVKLTVYSIIASVLLIVPNTYAQHGHIEANLGIETGYTVPIEITGMVSEIELLHRGLSSIFNTGFMISIGYVENGVIMWTSAPSFIPESWRAGLSHRHFSGVITKGPGARDVVQDMYFALMWNEGGIWGYPVNATIYDHCGVTVELEGCPFENLFDGEVELLFTDFHFESLLNDVIANLDSMLYMVVKADEPNVIENYLTVALVSDQLPLDTVYVELDQVDSYEARGSVGPIRTLGEESQVHINGFGTVYGFVYKGDDPQSEDWVEAGHLRINVQGITPTTANSFLSISQFFCTAHFRDDKGNYIPLTGVESVEWSSGANNILSGSLSPETGSNETFITYPDPQEASLTRGESLSYWIECAVTNKGETFAERIVLQQDDIDRLRQEYIDTHKASLPCYDSFRWTASPYFPKSKIRSNDYTQFLIDSTFLDSLDATYLKYRSIHDQPLEIYTHTDGKRKAYLSPNELFTYKPTGGIGFPTYYENDSESPHIYGLAVDLKVVDYPPEGLIDDWAEIAQLLTDHGINFIDTGDYSYVHAEYHHDPPPEQLIDLELDPESVIPGRQSSFYPPDVIRSIEICGNVSDYLEPYTNGLLTILVDEVPYSGGHNHIARPMNHHPSPNIFSGATLEEDNGEFYCEYEDPCQWGGQYFIRAIYQHGYHSYQVSDTLDITFNNLALLDSNEAYILEGYTDQHPVNHFFLNQFHPMAAEIANRFNALVELENPGETAPKIYINDISLENGGFFDIGPTDSHPNWQLWEDPHKFHRKGGEMDIYFAGQHCEHKYWKLLRKAILETIEPIEPDPLPPAEHQSPEYNCNHFHVYFFSDLNWE